MARLFPTTLSLLSFLVILLHTNPLPCNSQAVRDINGDIVRPNADYFIIPSGGGSIRLSSACDVVLQNITDVALPVKFTPKNGKDIFFNIDTDVNIEFDASTICDTSTVWSVVTRAHVIQRRSPRFVTIGGVISDPNNWFRIESSESDGYYVINFCPSGDSDCSTNTIGLIPGGTRLGLSSDPLLVSFAPGSSKSAPAPMN